MKNVLQISNIHKALVKELLFRFGTPRTSWAGWNNLIFVLKGIGIIGFCIEVLKIPSKKSLFGFRLQSLWVAMLGYPPWALFSAFA